MNEVKDVIIVQGDIAFKIMQIYIRGMLFFLRDTGAPKDTK